MTPLELTLLYLLAAVLSVAFLRSFGLPPILGYLIAGVLIEPHTLGFSVGQDAQGVRDLAEYGVVLLMFVIGLEVNLKQLRRMRRHVFGLGLSQVVATALLCTLAAYALSWLWPAVWPLSWQSALALSAAMAMSSTAIVVKMMAERTELQSAHGQRVLGVLLLQDLAVVPLLVLIPALGAPAEELLRELGVAMLKATALIAFLIWGGRHVMGWWLALVARRKSQELFMLNLLLLALGMAWLTQQAGLSMALGAFICGVLIAETPYRIEVEADIRPFHDVLLGLFFITIGMLLDWRQLATHWALIPVLLVFGVGLKFVLVVVLTRLWGASMGVALRTGIYLAQAGEFGFVLLSLSNGQHLISDDLFHAVLAAMVLSMLATPLLINASQRIVSSLVPSDWVSQSLELTRLAQEHMDVSQHVLICGFGRAGQAVARLIEGEGVIVAALDLDPDRVRQARAAGLNIHYGDATHAETLNGVALSRASAVVISFRQTELTLKTLHVIRGLAPQVPVVVRSHSDASFDVLRQAGAAEVVSEAFEGALMLASHALALAGMPLGKIMHDLEQKRDARYRLLRGYFTGASDPVPEELGSEQLRLFHVPPRWSSRSLQELASQLGEAQVIRLHNRAGQAVMPDEAFELQGGEQVLLSGNSEALNHASQVLDMEQVIHSS